MSSQINDICSLPSRVLLATDLADLKQILPVAIGHTLRCKAELKLVHVLPDVNTPDIDPTLLVHADRAVVKHYADTILENAAREAQSAGVKCSWTTRPGHVVEIIREVVKEWNPDRIIIGSHGHEKFQLRILGSVAESIFREIDVPVLAIGPAFQRSLHSASKKARILFATALDRSSRTITKSVLEFAKLHDAELTMLHVMREVAQAHPSSMRVRTYGERMFQEILAGIGPEEHSPTCMIEKGQVVETILRVASAGHFDLIVLGVVSGSSFRREIMPGTAYGIICGAPCPVFVLKEISDRSSTVIPAAS